ncbi:hypothetical protein [Hymenobacter properus]|uniref:Uncharacterized protein n=1 Tax=Hymenobacter properus TaxID=2791026 RepID=A0A931BAM0_9BACT|nr:hypothetical protein [Hymenobacter properus]MBF9140360.1 hypothetical protein [Hymenobacter properus]MBR7719167.1 hypothetical protein [Microvirga sp. SRT04]
MEVIIALLWPLLFMPTITGYMATSHGRSFWRWFGLGCVLPYLSLFVISYVVHRDRRRSRATATNPSNFNQP